MWMAVAVGWSGSTHLTKMFKILWEILLLAFLLRVILEDQYHSNVCALSKELLKERRD